MDSLLFLIVVVVMIIFVYKVLIEPLLNPKKEKRSSNYIVEVEDDEYLTDSRTVRTTQVSANLSPELATWEHLGKMRQRNLKIA